MLAIWFWILMLLALVLGGGYSQGKCPAWGPGLVLFLLLVILGLKVFGNPLS